MRAAALAVALAGLSGCAIPLTSVLDEEQVNTCATASDCGAGSACVARSGTLMCVATSVDLTGLTLVVSPVSGSTSVADTPFIFNPGSAKSLTRDDGTPFSESYSTTLPDLAQITFDPQADCSADGTGPAVPISTSIVLTRSESAAGLPPLTVTAVPDPTDAGNTRRIVSVPPGDYTAYITPQANTGGCRPPPPTLADVAVASPTAARVDLSGHVALSGSIANALSLEGWQLDVVDSAGGRPVSDVVALGSDGTFADLWLNWPDKQESPLLRLRPPNGDVAPTIYWQLASALGASSSYDVSLALGDFDPHALRHVEVVVIENARADPALRAQVSAFVTFQSESIVGVDNPAVYSVSVPTDAQGRAVPPGGLPPGRYLVTAVPSTNDSLGIGTVTLDVPASTDGDDSCFCGHTIPLPPKALLRGGVTTPQREALTGSPVQAVPSQDQALSFDALLGGDGVTPRSSSGLTSSDGSFALGIDAGGLLDLSVQPVRSSNFPWLVVSQVQVQASPDAELTTSDLGALALPAPAILSGTFHDPDGSPVVNATLRAYLPVVGALDPTGAPIVVLVGQTTTDLDGHYELLLPPSIAGSSTR
ncbi:MAG TPA: hypothetical protein VGM56_03870 [Byssovorax sp.]